jgi:hypothetical protein
VEKLLLQAESSLPLAKISFDVTAPASLCDSQKDIIFSNVPSSKIVSGLRMRMYLPDAFLIARLLAFEKPIFFSFDMTITSGYLFAM